MSKKNKNKRKLPESTEVPGAAKENAAAKPADSVSDDLKREFKHLALTITFILLLLAAIYYYDQQAHILKTFTDQIMGIF